MGRYLRVVMVAVLALVATAQASATTIVPSDGDPRWQRYADTARMPMPPITLDLRVVRSLQCGDDWAMGCVKGDAPSRAYVISTLSGRTSAKVMRHEAYHLLDEQYLSYADRDALRAVREMHGCGDHGHWWVREGDDERKDPCNERFAETAAVCASQTQGPGYGFSGVGMETRVVFSRTCGAFRQIIAAAIAAGPNPK